MSIRKSLAAAVVATAAAAFADDAIDLSVLLGARGEFEMPDTPPKLPRKLHPEAGKKVPITIMNDRFEKDRDLIAAGYRSDHPARFLPGRAKNAARKEVN